MAEIKFYQDEEKTVQVYPEINPDGNFPGVTVGLSDNLISNTGSTDSDAFTYQVTRNGRASTDGYAQIKRIEGNMTSTTKAEKIFYNLLTTGVSSINLTKSAFKESISNSGTYNFKYTPVITFGSSIIKQLDPNTFAEYVNSTIGEYKFDYAENIAISDSESLISSFNKTTFLNKIGDSTDIYTFIYDTASKSWKLNDETAIISQYGVTLKEDTTLTDTSSFSLSHSGEVWYYNDTVVNLSNYGIITTENEAVGDTFTIDYIANRWELNGSEISLSDYGISISAGSPALGDCIQVTYVKEEIGDVTIAAPATLHTIGMNQFNKQGSQILKNYTINGGAVIPSTGKYIVWIRVIKGTTYTIYNEDGVSSIKAYYTDINTPLTTTSSSLTALETNITDSRFKNREFTSNILVNDDTHLHCLVRNETENYELCYLVLAVDSIDNLCIHLTLDGSYENAYESYWDASLSIPYVDKDGNTISTYGLAAIGIKSDHIDFENKKYYKRINRVAYTKENYQNLYTDNDDDDNYFYDNDWIYYVDNEKVYNLADTIGDTIKISNFGIEEFLDKDGNILNLDLGTRIWYQDNLKSKLVNDVEVTSNKIDSTEEWNNFRNSNEETRNNNYYLTANIILALDDALRHLLGVDIETFDPTKNYSKGDLIINQLRMWKCIKDITEPGEWSGEEIGNLEVTEDDNNLITGLDSNEFLSEIRERGYDSDKYNVLFTCTADPVAGLIYDIGIQEPSSNTSETTTSSQAKSIIRRIPSHVSLPLGYTPLMDNSYNRYDSNSEGYFGIKIDYQKTTDSIAEGSKTQYIYLSFTTEGNWKEISLLKAEK